MQRRWEAIGLERRHELPVVLACQFSAGLRHPPASAFALSSGAFLSCIPSPRDCFVNWFIAGDMWGLTARVRGLRMHCALDQDMLSKCSPWKVDERSMECQSHESKQASSRST